MVATEETANQVVDLEKLKRLRDRRWEPGLTEPAAIGALQAALPDIIEVWEDRDRLRTACQQALEAIASCVVGWDYPDVPPMPAWAKRLESVVPMLQGALGIRSALEGRDG